MNWILVLVAVILCVGAYTGYRKGIIRIAVSLASMVVSLVACMFVTPALCTAIRTNTDIHSKMTESVYNMIIKSDAYNNAFEEALGDGAGQSGTASQESTGLTDSIAVSVANNLSEVGLGDYEEQISACIDAVTEAMKLPATVTKEYGSALISDAVADVVSEKVTSVKSLMAAIIAARLADAAIRSIVYIAVFAVIFIVMRVVLVTTGFIARLPIIRQANRLVGLVFGLCEALVVVWLMFAIITAFGNFEWASNALAMIGDNALLTFLYEQNLITRTILGG